MKLFERTAIFATIDSLQSQLNSLKTMIAALSQQDGPLKEHRVTKPSEDDSFALSDTDDDTLTKELERAREEEVKRMGAAAQAFFQQNLTEVADATHG